MFKDDDENDRIIGTFFYFSGHEYSESSCLRQQGKPSLGHLRTSIVIFPALIILIMFQLFKGSLNFQPFLNYLLIHSVWINRLQALRTTFITF